MNTHDDNDSALTVALAELADTMPEDPNRVEGIHARARRLRSRRRASRAAAAVVVGAATIAVVMAVRPGPAGVSTIPASDPGPVTPAACSRLTPPDTAAPSAPVSLSDADRAKVEAAANAPSATGGETAVTRLDGIKGYGTVAAVTDAAITVTPDEPIPDIPADVTAAVTDKTSFYDGDSEVTERPAVAAGDRVAFAAVVDGNGGYNLLLLQVNAPIPDPATDADKDEVSGVDKAAAADADADSAYLKGTAEIVSVQPDSLTLNVREGALAGQVINAALAPDVTYIVGDQKCVDPALAAGQVVGVVLMRGAGEAYTVQIVALFAG